MYLRSGTYYLVDHHGRWLNLGRDYAKAMAEYGRLTVEGPIYTVADMLARFLREESPKNSDATHKDDLLAVKPLKAFFGRMRPNDVEAQHCYMYLDERSKSASVRPNRELALLSRAFKKGIKWGIARTNPCKGVERLPEAARERDLTPEELAAFIDFCAEQNSYGAKVVAYYCVFKFITALRRRDILQLRMDQIRSDGIHVTPTKTKRKTGKRLIITWTPALERVISDIRVLQGKVSGLYLISNRKRQPYTPDGFSSLWDRWRRRALAAKVIVQNFNDTDIRAASSADVESLEEAARLLGHASPQTTQRHYRRRPAKVRPIR